MMRITLLAGAAALSLSPLLALPAQADTSAEITIAATHAGIASTRTQIGGVQLHLHHVLNCLVGPKGEGYDAGVGNPCVKAGNGAIPDATNADTKAKLEKIVTQINAALDTIDLPLAKSEAAHIKDALNMAK